MKALSEAIHEAATDGASGSSIFGDQNVLDLASREWSAHALVTYRGRLLRRALAISAALSDFTAELEMKRSPPAPEEDKP